MQTPEIWVTRRGRAGKWQSKDGKTGLSAQCETRYLYETPPEKRARAIVFTLSGEVRIGHVRHKSEMRIEADEHLIASLAGAINAMQIAAGPVRSSKQDSVEFLSEVKSPAGGVLYFGYRLPAAPQPAPADAFFGIRGPTGEIEIAFQDETALGEVFAFLQGTT
jgi:hypothetical protein